MAENTDTTITILRKAKDAYRMQRFHASRRGISWEMTFPEWWSFWNKEGRWESRGRGNGKLQMCRYGDTGPYALSNVYCATFEENMKGVPSSSRRKAALLLVEKLKSMGLKNGHNFPIRKGSKNHMSRRVVSPDGVVYETVTMSAKVLGITVGAAWSRIDRGWQGWRFLDGKISQ